MRHTASVELAPTCAGRRTYTRGTRVIVAEDEPMPGVGVGSASVAERVSDVADRIVVADGIGLGY